MCASSVSSRCAMSPAPAQRKHCRYFSTSSRWDHEKTYIVFRRSPDRGGILTSSKKNRKYICTCMIFALGWACQQSTDWYVLVPRVSYMFRNSFPPVVCCSLWHEEECGVAFLWCWVPRPSFPWPIQNNFVTVGCSRRVCWAFACTALFQLRPLSFSQRIYLRFYSNMALVLFCAMVRVRGRVGTAFLFLSRKVAAQLSEWACCSRWSCEAEQ